ncbi:MAG: DUF1080 domain-containing protein [Kiritimatiellia bacterium]
MNKILIWMMPLAVLAADMRHPAFLMREGELLEVLAGTNLNDRVTACQELGHAGTAAAVPKLAALLADGTEAVLFHAARYGLEQIPGPEAEAALRAACARTTGARRAGVEASLRQRARPVPDGYDGAAAALTAFPPKTPLQNGDPAVVPGLVEAALGGGFEATLARRHLVGFPTAALDGELLKLAAGADVKKARLAIGVLGDRRTAGLLPKFAEFARQTQETGVRTEIFKAFATLCEAPRDLRFLLDQVAIWPAEERLAGSVIRVCSRAFVADRVDVKILSAEYGYWGPNEVKDAAGKPVAKPVADVMDMVTALVAAGSRSIMSGNRLAGHGGFARDPAPGQPKELRLTYRIGDGPAISVVTPENLEAELAGCRLPDDVAGPLLDAAAAATGDVRAALLRIIAALEKRGVVPDPQEKLFRPIFNGRDLTGWSQVDGHFSVKDGVITGQSTAERPCKPNHHLVYTAEVLDDFELRAEFRLSGGANSGIQLRCKPQFIGDNGYQADMNGGGNYVGFLYHPRQHLVGERGADVVLAADGKKTVTRFADGKELQKLFRAGQWNDIRVVVKGRTIAVWINGVRTTSIEDPRDEFFPAKGHIALQLHQGPPMTVEFRNLRLKK